MIARYFRFAELGTSYRRELVGGLTTFVTMAYIIVVNPKILEAAGMPFGASMVATILSASFGTLLMGVYAKRPFGVAPYMGENAFVAYTVVKGLGYSWQTALGAIFISGVLFTLLTLLKIRPWLAKAIPESQKIAFTVGIGLFLTFIGLTDSGIVVLGVPGAPVHIGALHSLPVLMAIGTFLLIVLLVVRRVPGAILIGVMTCTTVACLVQFGMGGGSGAAIKLIELPTRFVSMPPDISPIFLKVNIQGALTWGFFSVVLTAFILDFVDTLGTLLGVSRQADLLDAEGNLPEIEKPMMVDALATTGAALLGTTTTGAYIESAAGIEAGARSGFASVVTGLLFLSALFFSPLFGIVPAFAYGPVLILIGIMMFRCVSALPLTDLTELVPAFTVVTLMCFSYNLGIGMTAGFILYPIMKLLSGRIREIHPGLWVLTAMSVLFFIFYPFPK